MINCFIDCTNDRVLEKLDGQHSILAYCVDAVINAGLRPMCLLPFGHEKFASTCLTNHWPWYPGPDTDRLATVWGAVQTYNCGFSCYIQPSPWVSPAELSFLARLAQAGQYDYVSNCLNRSIDCRNIECLSARAWKWLNDNAAGNGYRADVTSYLKKHQTAFEKEMSIVTYNEPLLSGWIPEFKLDLDTDLDYIRDVHSSYRSEIK